MFFFGGGGIGFMGKRGEMTAGHCRCGELERVGVMNSVMRSDVYRVGAERSKGPGGAVFAACMC